MTGQYRYVTVTNPDDLNVMLNTGWQLVSRDKDGCAIVKRWVDDEAETHLAPSPTSTKKAELSE